MARKPRIEFEGAFYHVLTRGNQKQKIFKDTQDYIKYLNILSEYKKKYPYYLYAYVLMRNHVHLLVESKKTPLSRIMQGINQRYTVYFNKKYNTVGHVFQGRYKSILCDRDAYLLSLVRYIHLNPVRGKTVDMPDEYKWSSHHMYIKRTHEKDLVDIDLVLRMFSGKKTRARRLYRTFIKDQVTDKRNDIYNTMDQRILGNEQFIDRVMEKYDVEIEKVKRKKIYSLSEIAKGIKLTYGISLKQVRGKSKQRSIFLCKKIFAFVAHLYGYSGKEIAFYMQKDPSVVSRYLKERSDISKEIIKLESVLSKRQ